MAKPPVGARTATNAQQAQERGTTHTSQRGTAREDGLPDAGAGRPALRASSVCGMPAASRSAVAGATAQFDGKRAGECPALDAPLPVAQPAGGVDLRLRGFGLLPRRGREPESARPSLQAHGSPAPLAGRGARRPKR